MGYANIGFMLGFFALVLIVCAIAVRLPNSQT
jgi:hypothetical protein